MTTTIPRTRRRSYSTEVAAVLTAAFTLSAAYTVYTTVTGLTPDGFNATSPVMWAFYVIGFGLAVAARTDRRWAWWTIAVTVPVLLAIGVLVYPPTFVPALQTPLGWFENDAYMGLLVLAEYLAVQRLRGITITP